MNAAITGETVMNKMLPRPLLAACLLAFALPAGADNATPHCDALDRNGNDAIQVNSDVDFENGDLVFREDGNVQMVITSEHALYIDGDRIELDARGQELVGQYHGIVEDVVEDALDLASDAASLGVSAAVEALAMVFSGADDMADFEERIEADAREIEAQADAMCAQLLDIEDIESELNDIVPGFQPRLFARHFE